jgi:predicted dehydrogenase
VVAAAAERLAQGAIGEPQTARIRMNGTWSARPGADLSLPHLLAPWYVDALDGILGSHPRRVLVQDGRGTEGRMQAYALTQLDYGGVWGTFQANISSVHGPETWVEVQGRDGDLFADLFTGELRIRTRSCPEWRVDRVVCALRPFAGWPGLRECLADFLDRLEGKPAPGVPAQDMARLHCLGLAAEESIDSLAWASVRSMDEWQQNLR